ERGARGVIGLERLRAWSERRLVGGEFEHFGSVRRGALARHIGLDREHAGTRFGTLSCGHRKLRVTAVRLNAVRPRVLVPMAPGIKLDGSAAARYQSGSGDPIAGSMAADERGGSDRSTGCDQRRADLVEGAALRHGDE